MPIEEPIHRLKPSRISFVKNYALSVIFAAFLVYLFIVSFPITQIGLAASITLIFIFIIHPEIERMRNTYVVTSSQVITEEGIISRRRRSIFLNNASDVSVRQNFLQRMLHYGSINIGSSSGRDYMELVFKGVERPKELAYSIERLIKDYTATRPKPDAKKDDAKKEEK